jgi:NAD(P)-dependent dehydrogenase (short-subunit alcohol dehydrogenase family)
MKHINRIAIVTGAARGIGLACARRLKTDGAAVVLADILDEEGMAAAKELDGTYAHCDVANSADVARLVETALRAHGAIDILINNAGVAAAGDFLDISEADFDRVIAVNLKGAFLVAQACAKQMVKQVKEARAPGAIVNMSSVNAVVAIASQVPYTMSKGGINQMTKVAALGLASYGIRVNAIGPGSIMTGMLASVAQDLEAQRRVLSRTPMGRIGDPAEVAAIASFLASDDASYITGQTVYCDGGRLPLNYVVPVTN